MQESPCFSRGENVNEESSIKKFPKNRTLLVSVCYDGQIIIRQDSQTKEIIPIKNGEQKKIYVDSDSEIIVTQGCDAVRTLSVDVQEKSTRYFCVFEKTCASQLFVR